MAQELNVVDVYNDLHQIPELGFQEFKTSAYIAEKLKQMGYEVTTGVGKRRRSGSVRHDSCGYGRTAF